MSEITDWLVGRLPSEWFEGAPDVSVDREEIVVVGRLAPPEAPGAGPAPAPDAGAARPGAPDSGPSGSGPSGSGPSGSGPSDTGPPDTGPPDTGALESGRIARFREETRHRRMQVAREAEARFGRQVAWGAACGQTREMFTHLSVPVMTRLRQEDRLVLDTLVDAGVARSRSGALAWTVRLVRQHEDDWLRGLREALDGVESARNAGPSA